MRIKNDFQFIKDLLDTKRQELTNEVARIDAVVLALSQMHTPPPAAPKKVKQRKRVR